MFHSGIFLYLQKAAFPLKPSPNQNKMFSFTSCPLSRSLTLFSTGNFYIVFLQNKTRLGWRSSSPGRNAGGSRCQAVKIRPRLSACPASYGAVGRSPAPEPGGPVGH